MQPKNNIFTLIFTFLSIFCVPAFAKSNVKNGSTYAKVIHSSVQRIIPGVRGMPLRDQYTFTLVWQSTHAPETFYWKVGEEWTTCRVAILSTHTDSIVKKGDTIQLSPIANGQYTIPERVAKLTKPSIVLKNNKNEWLYIPVGKIDKKPDIIMP